MSAGAGHGMAVVAVVADGSLAAERKERARIHSEKGIRWGDRPLATTA
ncbi:hypothetical protein [Streptomyces sp. NPDC004135]